MALTTDKRRNITTISSQSSRMGVVQAYSGDAVGVLAENMSKKLDFFAKRQAVLEENKYKADTQHKVYKAIQEYGRTHFDNPAAFSVRVTSKPDLLRAVSRTSRIALSSSATSICVFFIINLPNVIQGIELTLLCLCLLYRIQ